MGVELLYNSVEFEPSGSSIGDRDRRDVVGKTTLGQRGPREPPWSLGTREIADKMQ